MDVRRLVIAWFAGTALVGVPGAQDEVRQDLPAFVRVIGLDDGRPRPGVTVHVVPRGGAESTLDARGEFIRPVDSRIRDLRRARSVRTDPDGRARLPVDIADLAALRVFAGAPFESRPAEIRDGEILLRVVQHEPFAVRAVDSEGRPFADFAVALHAAGRDVSVALTDARGVAVLGVPSGFDARLSVAPAGWIGGRSAFPSVATMLERSGPIDLVVPPHGTFCVRIVRRGRPGRGDLSSALLFEPQVVQAVRGPRDADAAGVEFGPLALGTTLRGTLTVGERSTLFEAIGPQIAGERAVFDLEIDPPRPQLGFRLTDVGRAAARSVPIEVRAVTDDGVETATASIDDEGHVRVDFGARLALGAHLVRVDIDVDPFPVGEQPLRGFSAAVPVDRRLEDGVLELGQIELVAHPPVLRGRVVDGRGAPVPGARVEVRSDSAEARGVRLVTDEDGRFRLLGPLPRRPDGSEGRSFAVATLGSATSEPSPMTVVGGEVSLTIGDAEAARTALVESARVGSATARFRDLPASIIDQLVVDLIDVDAGRRVLEGALIRPAAGEEGIVAGFERVPPGRYTMRLRAPYLDVVLFELRDVDVPADGASSDPRLLALEVGAALRVASLRVVDAEGVPVAGAVLEARAGPRALARSTDARGQVAIAFAASAAPTLTITAEGLRPQRFVAVAGDATVGLEPAGTLVVRVIGLPPDLEREPLRIWVQPADRLGQALGEQVGLDASDVARLQLPARGSHLVALEVTFVAPNGGQRSWRVASASVPLAVGDGPEVRTELHIDADAVRRARDAIRTERR